jgi:hypothetical protein
MRVIRELMTGLSDVVSVMSAPYHRHDSVSIAK